MLKTRLPSEFLFLCERPPITLAHHDQANYCKLTCTYKRITGLALVLSFHITDPGLKERETIPLDIHQNLTCETKSADDQGSRVHNPIHALATWGAVTGAWRELQPQAVTATSESKVCRKSEPSSTISCDIRPVFAPMTGIRCSERIVLCEPLWRYGALISSRCRCRY